MKDHQHPTLAEWGVANYSCIIFGDDALNYGPEQILRVLLHGTLAEGDVHRSDQVYGRWSTPRTTEIAAQLSWFRLHVEFLRLCPWRSGLLSQWQIQAHQLLYSAYPSKVEETISAVLPLVNTGA